MQPKGSIYIHTCKLLIFKVKTIPLIILIHIYCKSILLMYQVEYATPSLQCDELKHGQESNQEVVKRSEPIVGSLPPVDTLTVGGAMVNAHYTAPLGTWKIAHQD